ncbi:hypothetical protein HS088_TW21G01283 [Tripterygium wilfordii]|uniref:F-box protein n=1 Tax=Tripterygium wilfordii TaxID=458696 RepID=A0A7J7C5A8_TRIWF|nr:hypothetical protein HS088_TW21G01283 [Tripterygium wilfordii]
MTKRAAKNKHRDWSQLIPEILDLIASRLSLDDYYRFGSVCTTWRHSTLSRSSYQHPLPWLMYSRRRTSETSGVYCLQSKKFYQIPMPEDVLQNWWVGSSHGWLIRSDKNLDNYLFQPLTENNISLPNNYLFNPFTGNKISLPNNSRSLSKSAIYKNRVPRSIKAILSSEPTMSNIAAGQCVVAAIMSDDVNYNDDNLAFCRPGDESWTSCKVLDDFDLQITSIIFSNGKLYAITRFLQLYVCNIDRRQVYIMEKIANTT